MPPPPLRTCFFTVSTSLPRISGPTPFWPAGWQPLQFDWKIAWPAAALPAAPPVAAAVGAVGAVGAAAVVGEATAGEAAGLVGAAAVVGEAAGFVGAVVGAAVVGAAGLVGATVGVGAADGPQATARTAVISRAARRKTTCRAFNRISSILSFARSVGKYSYAHKQKL